MGPQIGSAFKTAQLIGAMRDLTRRAGIPFVGYLAGHHKVWAKRGLKDLGLRDWVSYGKGSHTKDAERLGYYHVHVINNKGKGY
jgi:hypothetical protein